MALPLLSCSWSHVYDFHKRIAVHAARIDFPIAGLQGGVSLLRKVLAFCNSPTALHARQCSPCLIDRMGIAVFSLFPLTCDNMRHWFLLNSQLPPLLLGSFLFGIHCFSLSFYLCGVFRGHLLQSSIFSSFPFSGARFGIKLLIHSLRV
jgi:hypothetical protein